MTKEQEIAVNVQDMIQCSREYKAACVAKRNAENAFNKAIQKNLELRRVLQNGEIVEVFHRDGVKLPRLAVIVAARGWVFVSESDKTENIEEYSKKVGYSIVPLKGDGTAGKNSYDSGQRFYSIGMSNREDNYILPTGRSVKTETT